MSSELNVFPGEFICSHSMNLRNKSGCETPQFCTAVMSGQMVCASALFMPTGIGLSLKDAAEKLAADFGIITEHPTSKPPAQQIPHSAHLRSESEWLRHAVAILVQYERLLKQWKERFAPSQPSEELHPLFVEALRQSDRISYLLDMALCSDETERHAFYLNYFQLFQA